MNEIWQLFLTQWQQQSIFEVFAFIFAVAYIWLASEESIWCWPAGLISTALYSYVFWEVSVFYQMLLNIYYMGMAVYGFISWQKQGEDKTVISKFTLKHHLIFSGLGIGISILFYFATIYWFTYQLVWLDISISVFSLMTTWLTVKKILECWIYWTIINIASLVLFNENALYVSMLLMIVYIIIAIRAWVQWRQTYCNIVKESQFSNIN
ncbi:nicotinamide riboside transporter PnuC [Glaciecola petra]|uniref:Nicotinamide riboside transporter PnuC n=1 Tax=Glaciecola petra TaxID=3075602 RepID=A0ABU2ZNB3_9ALTE|nr:nicotinamide riboside transporter PnuC [Aestuariibacter sp. P117]MDT0593885.1 nicotinamide riboside transporter PnuC [Aestuariibacter sp. P117]